MYYNYGGNAYNPSGLQMNLTSSASNGIWVIVSFILALIGAFLVYFLFIKSKNKFTNKFVVWLRSFLDFSEMLIEPILKISYLFLAIFITLSSFALIGSSFVGFLLMLIFGNLILRVIYEFSILLISIWKNTRDINKKMK